MNPKITILLLVVLVSLMCFFIEKAIKQMINLWVLFDSKRHPEKYSWKEGEMVYNRKTGKLESTSRKVILPF